MSARVRDDDHRARINQMAEMTFTQELADELYNSDEQFPVDGELAWQWLGYSRKDKFTNMLLNNFEENIDYGKFSPSRGRTPQGGHPSDLFLLTIDCFKMIGMMAKTEKGKEIREYFLNCERQLKDRIKSDRIPAFTPELLAAARFFEDSYQPWALENPGSVVLFIESVRNCPIKTDVKFISDSMGLISDIFKNMNRSGLFANKVMKDNDRLRKDLERLVTDPDKSVNEKLRGLVDSLKRANGELSNNISSLEQENRRLDGENSRLRQEMANQATVINSLQDLVANINVKTQPVPIQLNHEPPIVPTRKMTNKSQKRLPTSEFRVRDDRDID